jgi:hypothetical protein
MITLSWYHDNMLSFLFFLKTSHTEFELASIGTGSYRSSEKEFAGNIK